MDILPKIVYDIYGNKYTRRYLWKYDYDKLSDRTYISQLKRMYPDQHDELIHKIYTDNIPIIGENIPKKCTICFIDRDSYFNHEEYNFYNIITEFHKQTMDRWNFFIDNKEKLKEIMSIPIIVIDPRKIIEFAKV